MDSIKYWIERHTSCSNGYGDGYGSGNGDGYGDGDGSGDGGGTLSYCGNAVYIIDGIQTVILSVIRDYAKGYIISDDLTVTPCYIAARNGFFAHGNTLREAENSLSEKELKNMPTEERINMFLSEFRPNIKYPAAKLYEWHNILTGSCKFGRDEFIKSHGINLESDMYSIDEFINLTEDSYGGEIIRRLKDRLEAQKNGKNRSEN